MQAGESFFVANRFAMEKRSNYQAFFTLGDLSPGYLQLGVVQPAEKCDRHKPLRFDCDLAFMRFSHAWENEPFAPGRGDIVRSRGAAGLGGAAARGD
jgi:hypothetical protein